MKGLSTVYGQGDLGWLFWEYWAQAVPSDDWEGIQRYQLETFAKKIMPEFATR